MGGKTVERNQIVNNLKACRTGALVLIASKQSTLQVVSELVNLLKTADIHDIALDALKLIHGYTVPLLETSSKRRQLHSTPRNPGA